MVATWSILVALLIVTGQALWKSAADMVSKSHNLFSIDGLFEMLKHPKLYLGALVYATATIAYIILLGKYKYFQVQSIVVGGSILITVVIAGIVFHENISTLNIIGIGLILVGVLFVVLR